MSLFRLSNVRTLIIINLILLFGMIKPVLAATFVAPTARVLLTISGNIEQTNDGEQAVFDLEMLKQLPQHQLLTTTPWTEGVQSFDGVLLSDLLTKVTTSHNGIKAMAIDNFSAEISAEEIKNYPILIGYAHNGKRMKIRHKGPLWVIYPLDQYPELKNAVYHDRMVWQLDKIEVK